LSNGSAYFSAEQIIEPVTFARSQAIAAEIEWLKQF